MPVDGRRVRVAHTLRVARFVRMTRASIIASATEPGTASMTVVAAITTPFIHCAI